MSREYVTTALFGLFWVLAGLALAAAAFLFLYSFAIWIFM